MAGRLTVSTLNNDTGPLAVQNGMTGVAKAWVVFAGATGTINGSFNVGSVTRNGTGDYTVNFSTPMSNANYSAIGNAGIDTPASAYQIVYPNSTGTSPFYQAATTTACRFVTAGGVSSANLRDALLINFAVFGI